jgi:hypothetical protein
VASSKTRTPYQDTSVPVGRSQSNLRDLLKDAGATGIQFGEDFERGAIEIRFGWVLENGQPATIRLQAVPLEPEPGRYSNSPPRISEQQRERQCWRGLYWYLKAMIEASQFGLLAFEDVFLSFFEARPHGPTVGEVVINQLQLHGRLELTSGDGLAETVVVE